MATVIVKNIPRDLYENLKRAAKANRRSINSEIIVCIERAIGTRVVDTQETLARARRLRELTADYVIGDEEFGQAKAASRP